MKKGSNRSFLTSGEIARARAQLAVCADRLNSRPERMDELRREVRNVLEKYINIEDENIQISITFAGDSKALSGRSALRGYSFPVSGAETERENVCSEGSGHIRKRGASDVKTIQIK